MSTVNELRDTNCTVYSARACPAWESSVLVDVGTACSAEEFAHVYLRVPSESGRALMNSYVLRDASTSRTRATVSGRSLLHAATSTIVGAFRVSKTPGVLVIGVPSHTWGPSTSAMQYARGRSDRRPSSLSGLIETATTRRLSWATTLLKSQAPPG